jgi:hypothetical protein
MEHVWYFSIENKIAIVGDFDHWWWHDFCRWDKRAVVYLGEL